MFKTKRAPFAVIERTKLLCRILKYRKIYKHNSENVAALVVWWRPRLSRQQKSRTHIRDVGRGSRLSSVDCRDQRLHLVTR